MINPLQKVQDDVTGFIVFIIILISIIYSSLYFYNLVIEYNDNQAKIKLAKNSITAKDYERLSIKELLNQDPSIIKQQFITVNNQKYGLPIKKDLTGLQKLMLLGIRIPEWGNRLESQLDGDLDSFCPYQQRASELMLADAKQSIVKKYFDYSKTFTPDRSQFLHMYKRTQLSLKTDTDVTFPFGVPHPFTIKHWGTDFGYNYREVVTPVDGEVQQVTFDPQGGGNVVVIKHTSNIKGLEEFRTLYAHLDKSSVKIGDKLFAGQIFAISGNSGASTGAHLHFQMMSGSQIGNWNNPALIINPENQLYIMKIMSNKFVALKQELISIHLRTGFCDELAIQRLYEEPSTFNYLKQKKVISNKDDLYKLLQDLCSSQRPHDCMEGVNGNQSWVSRAYNVLSTDDTYKKIQGI